MKTETANGVVSGWSYDSDFRVTSHAINDAGVGYTYDNDSLLTGAGAATLTRSPDSGFLTRVTVGSVSTAFGYNGYGEVESVTSGSLYSEGLQYDSAGRLTVIQESVNGIPAQYTYTYDSVGRLTSATKDGTQTTTWTYDGNGNRPTENGVTSTFDAQDRLLARGSTSYTWDALGGRKTKTESGQTRQYTHDGLGALLSVTLPDSTQLTYEYDARQRRVAKRRNGTVEARWVYDGQYRVAAQLDASGTVTHRFVYGSQSHSPDYVVTGGVTYAYVKNHLGSIRFVVNAATSTVAQQLDYDAWGNVLTDSAPGFQPFAFAGGMYDRDNRLTHFGFRDYDASAGVWTAKDPIRLIGGYNVYAYSFSSPVLLVDPTGGLPIRAAFRAVGAGIKLGKRLKEAAAIRRLLQGGDIVAESASEARRLANKASQARGGGGLCEVDPGHALRGGGKGVPHAHPLGKGGERIEGAGHIFIQNALELFLDEVGNAIVDPDGDGVAGTVADVWEWANPLPIPMPMPSQAPPDYI